MMTLVMSKKTKLFASALIILVLAVVTVAAIYLSSQNIFVLNPKGTIADKQRNLIILATALMSLVIIPVFVLTFGIAWRYREGNKKAKYSPELGGNFITEFVWWFIPFVIITILAFVAWTSSHDLDPFKPLASDKKPLKIQVVALQWKWLFIYPEQKIASVNFIEVPKDTPLDFEITADAPMNSFWIPQLGGQIYAMSGMSTQLHLMATAEGDYYGSSANISGKGFAGMKFITRATTTDQFNSWVKNISSTQQFFTHSTYDELAKPSSDTPQTTMRLSDDAADLYDTVVKKYMGH